MAEVVWTEPALDQLNDLAEYIALDNPDAAYRLVGRVFEAAERLTDFPESGRCPPELPDSVYRELVIPPCRVFYRGEKEYVYILHVFRQEQEIRSYLRSSE